MKHPHSRTLALFTFILALTAGTVSTQAADLPLVWEDPDQSFNTDFDQAEVVATYSFSNTGKQTVTITSAKASCGCTVPSLEKKIYASGENGDLKAIFTIGSRQGHQHKTITVTTLEDGSSNEQVYSLNLDVEIPVPVQLKPRVRFWKIGTEATTQEIRITLNAKFPMAITGITRKDADQNETFDYQLETITANKEYLLKVTPKAAGEKSRDVVYLSSKDDSKNTFRKYPIYLYVR